MWMKRSISESVAKISITGFVNSRSIKKLCLANVSPAAVGAKLKRNYSLAGRCNITLSRLVIIVSFLTEIER